MGAWGKVGEKSRPVDIFQYCCFSREWLSFWKKELQDQHIVISRGNIRHSPLPSSLLPNIWKQEYCIAEEAVLWFANFIFHPIGFGWSVTEVKGRLFKKAVSMQHCFGHTTNLYFLLNIERLRKLWYITWEKFHNGDFIFCQPGDTLQNGKVYHSSF